MPSTMFDKIWDTHEVADGLIYVDLPLVHEVTSPQAFDGLRLEGRKVRRPDKTVATADHNVPTDGTPAARLIADELSRIQVETLERNCAEFGIPVYSLGSERQGIVHVIGPELGLTQPGLVIACGDSHTATHGAFGALAFGIGTSEVEHVLATQCLVQRRPKTMRIDYSGGLGAGVTAKDLILATIGRLGVGGMVGHVTDAGPGPAEWGKGLADREAAERALHYMGLEPGIPMEEIELDRVFIGSCTNSRVQDLREAAAIVEGRRVSSSVRAMVVPGSQRVKAQAEEEGLDETFRAAGFEWRTG